MTIWHVDRTGGRTEFNLDITPTQERILYKVLDVARNPIGGASLSLSYLQDAEANDLFITQIEKVILKALKEYEKLQTDMTPTYDFLDSDTTAVPEPEPTPPAQPHAAPEPVEEREPYYWEKF